MLGLVASIKRKNNTMRKNIHNVLKAFDRQQSHVEKTCSTDGNVIKSYSMIIGVRCRGQVYTINESESPSVTTTGQIRAIHVHCDNVQAVDNTTFHERVRILCGI